MDFSTFSAISEIFVTAAVFTVVFSSMFGKGFYLRLAVGVAVFEFSVNMLYMVSRMNDHATSSSLSNTMKVFAAVHGALSLLVFCAFVLLASLDYYEHRKGRSFFQRYKFVTWTFIVFWIASVASGDILYFLK